MPTKNQATTKPQQHKFDKIAMSAIRIIVGVLVGIQFIVPIVTTYMNINGNRISFAETPEDYGLEYEKIEFNTDDDLILKGWYIKGKLDISPGILLVHGIGTNRADLLDIAYILNKNGYAVLTFDLRSHGLSDGDKRTFGIKEYNDIKAALMALAIKSGVDEKRLGIYAISYGGTMTLQALYKSEFVKNHTQAVFLDSVYADLDWLLKERFLWSRGFISPLASYIAKTTAKFLLNDDPFIDQPIDFIQQIEKPIYFVHGSEDRTINKKHSIALHQLKKLGYKYIWLAPLSDHLEAHRDYPLEYKKKMLEFFKKHL